MLNKELLEEKLAELPDVAVKTVLQPLRSGAQALTSHAEGIYNYLFGY